MALDRRGIVKTLGYLTLLAGGSMLPSLLTAWYFGELAAFDGFALSALISFSIGTALIWAARRHAPDLRVRDGMIVVAFGWLIVSAVGALPYTASGVLHSFIDAWFESVSGFTTTGATVFSDVETLPRSLLMWRSLSQWLGGMGILVFVLSILPSAGGSGHSLLFAETSGLNVQKLDTRHRGSAQKLYTIYASLALVQIGLLYAGGLPLSDSAALSLGSIASSGLLIHNDGLMHYNSAYVEAILACFMILSCINFTLYHRAVRGEFQKIKNNTELRAFLGLLVACSALVSVCLWNSGVYDAASSIRYGAFQTVSFMTTTGHTSTDLSEWPSFVKAVLTVLSFVGGQAASTSGGIKIVRIIILLKLIRRSFIMRIHPRAVVGVKLEGQALDSAAVNGVIAFFFTYLALFAAGAFLLSFDIDDMGRALLSSAAMLGNTGVAVGAQGAIADITRCSAPSRLLMCVLMLAGRLEIYTVMLLGRKTFWTHSR
ncbi:MAG TPA: TrkH family potassium uptake protein [Clostridiales bacterium]|nr:TrkH family potassium uptake protein [Clostridiales bacterium]